MKKLKIKHFIRWLLFVIAITYFTFFTGNNSPKELIIFLLVFIIGSGGIFLLYRKDKLDLKRV